MDLIINYRILNMFPQSAWTILVDTQTKLSRKGFRPTLNHMTAEKTPAIIGVLYLYQVQMLVNPKSLT